MLRGTGMSIAQMREFAAVYRASGDERERLRLLEEHREIALARLEETRRHLVALDVKIAAYRTRWTTSRADCWLSEARGGRLGHLTDIVMTETSVT